LLLFNHEEHEVENIIYSISFFVSFVINNCTFTKPSKIVYKAEHILYIKLKNNSQLM